MPPRIRRRVALALAAVTAALAAAPGPAAAGPGCPGAIPTCPYTVSGEIGLRAGGVLRFPQAVAVGPDGTVYVGDQGSQVVQVFNPEGVYVGEIGRPGNRPGELTAVGALTVAEDGTLIVADGSNRIMRFHPDGRLLSHWGRTGSGVGQFRFGGGRGNDAGAGGGLAAAAGMLYVADSGNNRIQRFTLDGGQGAEIVPPGELGYPKGLDVRGTRLFVADNQNHRVLVMDTGGRLLKTIETDRSAGRGKLSHPYGVTTDPWGRVFVADNMNHRIVRFSVRPDYPYKARWGAYGTAPGRLAYPRAIASDGEGRLYVANTGNDRVDVFDRGGNLLRSFGASGRSAGQFNSPVGVAADASGLRAVADSVNGRIQLLHPDGSVAAVWGSPNPGPTILLRPVAIVFDARGDAFVLDQRRARIFVFDRSTGEPVRSIAAQGSGPGRLNDPSDLAIDAAGRLYVADTGNRRIARFTAGGDYLGSITEAGRVRGVAVTPDGSRIYTSGNGARITVYDAQGNQVDRFGGAGRRLGRLNAPAQISLGPAGNVWVADRGNHRVQAFSPAGEPLLAFGERGVNRGQFHAPMSVSVDCRGVVTVGDRGNNRVQQFSLAVPPPASCRQLPPPATPPAPQVPTLPPPDGPAIELQTLRRQGVLRMRNLPIRVGCDTRCEIEASLEITPRARPRRGRKRVSVTIRERLTLDAGASRIVRFRLSRGDVRRLRRALGGRSGLFADLRLEATSSVGETTQLSDRIEPTA